MKVPYLTAFALARHMPTREASVLTSLSTAGRQIHLQATASTQSKHSEQSDAPEPDGTIDLQPEQSSVPQQADGSSDDALVPPADIKRQLVLEEISRSGEMGASSYRSDTVHVLPGIAWCTFCMLHALNAWCE